MIKLKRLEIGKYRHVKPGTELRFSDGFNVLLGQNATGKTTLLELITAVLRSDTQALSREELDIEYDLSSETGTIRVKLENRETEASSQPEIPGIRPGMGSMALTYDVSLRNNDSSAQFVGTGNKATLKQPSEPDIAVDVHPLDHNLITSLVFSGLNVDRWVDMILEQGPLWKNLRRFDESLSRFDELLAMSFTVYRTRKHVNFVGASYASGSLLKKVPDSAMGELPRGIQIPASELEFLSKAVSRFDLASAEIRLDLLRQEPAKEQRGELLTFGKPSFFFVDHDGSGFTQDRLSYGQKRLLSFLYYLECNEGVCVADELVNGLHHEWIAACVEDLGKRQTFLASQNPLLLDHLEFSSAEEARQSFICCTRERTDKKTTLHWENMGEEDASAFYRAYDAGLQHVGEILRTQGLW